MAIYKNRHVKNYMQCDNSTVCDKNLSLKASGLLVRMLSKPKDWKFSIDGLVSMCKEGKTAIKTALKELEAIGYVIKKQIRDKFGRIDYIYEVYETATESTTEAIPESAPAESQKPQVKKQATEKPSTETPYTENLSTAYYYNTKERVTKTEGQSSPTLSLGEFKNVPLTAEQYQKLETQFGSSQVQKSLEKFSAWLQYSGKTFKDYFTRFLIWIKQDAEQACNAPVGSHQQNSKFTSKQSGKAPIQIPENDPLASIMPI